jgi:predicted phosphodiesterase
MKQYGGLLLLNPGEACGWVTGLATAAFFDTDTGRATLFEVTSGKAIQTSRLE